MLWALLLFVVDQEAANAWLGGSPPEEEAEDDEAADEVESAVKLDPMGMLEAVAVAAEPVESGCATIAAVVESCEAEAASVCDTREADDEVGCNLDWGADRVVNDSKLAILARDWTILVRGREVESSIVAVECFFSIEGASLWVRGIWEGSEGVCVLFRVDLRSPTETAEPG